MNSMEKTRAFLRSVGLPGGDAYDLPTSEKRFADGGQYRFEVPGIQGPKVMQALLEAMDSYGLYLHRVTQTQGIMRLTDEEISVGKLAAQALMPLARQVILLDGEKLAAAVLRHLSRQQVDDPIGRLQQPLGYFVIMMFHNFRQR